MELAGGKQVMELAGDITVSDMEDLVESILGGAFWNKCSSANVDVDVRVDDDLIPNIFVNTDDQYFKIHVATVELYEDDVHIGWGYDADITIVGDYNVTLDSPEGFSELSSRMSKWQTYSEIAMEISDLEVIPDQYFD